MPADHPSREAYASAAWLLRCEVEAIQAVGEVEAGAEGAFLPSGEPVILFERHVFHQLTSGKWSGTHPGISNPSPGGYGATSSQHSRLDAAVGLNRGAALRSASWGLFQQLGRDQRYSPDLQRFVTAMYREVDDHLRAFVLFIRANDKLVDAIRARNWESFARHYNGPAFKRNAYDTKMRAAYERLAGAS